MAYKGIVLRAYPTDAQRQKIEQTFGCCRLVHNQRLTKRKELNDFSFRKPSYATVDYYKSEFPFLADVDKNALLASLKDQEDAIAAFRNNTDATEPKFKSKRNHRQTYRTWNVSIKQDQTKAWVNLPVVGSVLVRGLYGTYQRLIGATVKREPTGQYYIVLQVQFEPEIRTNKGGQTGVDVGLGLYVVDSNGEAYENPQYYEKALKRLKRAQRSLDRKQQDGKNREKQRIRVARLHAKIANQRKDFLQKVTTDLIRENQTICVEELDVESMLKSKVDSLRISSASWRTFREMLTYKGAWYGNKIVPVASSQINRDVCPGCGYKSAGTSNSLTHMRICPHCNAVYDGTKQNAIRILELATT